MKCRHLRSHRVREQHYKSVAILAAKLLKVSSVLEVCDSAWRPFGCLASPYFRPIHADATSQKLLRCRILQQLSSTGSKPVPRVNSEKGHGLPAEDES